ARAPRRRAVLRRPRALASARGMRRLVEMRSLGADEGQTAIVESACWSNAVISLLARIGSPPYRTDGARAIRESHWFGELLRGARSDKPEAGTIMGTAYIIDAVRTPRG